MVTKIIFLDTETGGLSENAALTQLSGIIQINKEIKEEFNIFIKPFEGSLVSDEALRIQNRTREELETDKFITEKEAYRQFKSILDKYVDKFDKNDKFVISGYNIRYDIDIINRFFNRQGDHYFFSYVEPTTLDPFNLIAILQLCGMLPKLHNNKLESWCNYYNIKLQAHDALEDIKATRELIYKFVRLFYQKKQEEN